LTTIKQTLTRIAAQPQEEPSCIAAAGMLIFPIVEFA